MEPAFFSSVPSFNAEVYCPMTSNLGGCPVSVGTAWTGAVKKPTLMAVIAKMLSPVNHTVGLL